MNLSIEEVLSNFDRMGSDPIERQRAKALTDKQRQKEQQILSGYSFCPASNIKDKLANLNPKELSQMISNDFDKSVVMEEVGCIIGNVDEDSIGYRDQTQKVTLDSSTKLNQWFTNPKQIGAESVAGIAVLADMKGSKAVIKEPRNPKDRDVIHEIFVSILGTNSQRKLDPNFAYVYSHFLCTPSVIDDTNKKVTSFCGEGDTKVLHTVYEAIAPATDAYKVAQSQTLLQYLSMVIQVALALQIANETIGFHHGDLHGENVLFRDVSAQMKERYEYADDEPVEFYIPYETKQHKFYLLANGVATIIDFGRSMIKYKGEVYGFNEPGLVSSWDKDYPIADLFRFFTFTLKHALLVHRDDKGWIKMAINLLKFFYPTLKNERELFEIIEVCDETYGFIPYRAGIKPIDFVIHFKKVAPELFDIILTTEKPDSLPILGCGETTSCPVKRKVEQTLGLTGKPTANTIFEFFTANTATKSKVEFNYVKAMKQHVAEYKKLLNESQNVELTDFDGTAATTDVFDLNTLKYIKGEINKIVSTRTNFHLLEKYIAIGESVANDYMDVNMVKYFKYQLTNYRQMRNQLNNIIKHAKQYIMDINKLIKTPKGDRLYRSNKKYRWYQTVAPNYF